MQFGSIELAFHLRGKSIIESLQKTSLVDKKNASQKCEAL